MSSLLRWLLTAPFIILVVGFSALHAEEITINLEPLLRNISVPLFVPVIAFVFIGFVWGALINWTNSAPQRQKIRTQNKEIKTLNKEITALKSKLSDDKNSPASGKRSSFDLLPSAQTSQTLNHEAER
jgi:predicted histidine transporter YuiF (NhaC family)